MHDELEQRVWDVGLGRDLSLETARVPARSPVRTAGGARCSALERRGEDKARSPVPVARSASFCERSIFFEPPHIKIRNA